MAEPLCCPPETVTTLLTGHTPRQNKKLNKFFQKRKLKASPHITFSERFCLLYAILSSQFAYISHIYQKSIKQNVLNHLIATCSFNSRLSFPKQQQKPFRTLKITSLFCLKNNFFVKQIVNSQRLQYLALHAIHVIRGKLSDLCN